MEKGRDIGIIILAAGASKRFGSAKQLAKFEGETLIKRIGKTAISLNFTTVVVLGSRAEEIRKEIESLPVEIVTNSSWRSGMSSSIRTGLNRLLEIEPKLDAVILLLCDQPFITKEIVSRLLDAKRKTRKSIVASQYSDTLGTPAFFSRDHFAELLNLEGDQGAKAIITKCSDTAVIPTPEAQFDIDTIDDLTHLMGT